MKRIICASLSLLLLLTGCTTPAPTPLPTESFKIICRVTQMEKE